MAFICEDGARLSRAFEFGVLVVDDRCSAGEALQRAVREIPAAAQVDARLLHVDEGKLGRLADGSDADGERADPDGRGRFFFLRMAADDAVFRFQLAHGYADEAIIADEREAAAERLGLDAGIFQRAGDFVVDFALRCFLRAQACGFREAGNVEIVALAPCRAQRADERAAAAGGAGGERLALVCAGVAGIAHGAERSVGKHVPRSARRSR